ncbi:F0F1 ATP synthase subunit delta [Hahella aquimaris]|uniref:F0F1 ATP synthase subunit delta n=1 Tax=Hahella sp. HNIBRBA332 TaxID=3015983 RepID=UPI00273CF04B|nr:F0F1 ATP synthase subunit delta [Hahella sp. HNIBRBA332]WLQ12328.1 F0F1 ATP synthase subunit delta [Hahella sp. HNIBRBA332]
MELDWTTVALEIINFIILVWLLKRFLYRPVLNIVEQRQANIKASLDRARDVQEQADALKRQYNERLQTWEQERQEARHKLQEELAREKAGKLESLRTRLDQEVDKARAARESQNQQWRRETAEQALQMGAGFASALLRPLADPHLEERLVNLFCERVSAWPTERLSGLRNGGDIEISTAYPLQESAQRRLQETLQTLAADHRSVLFQQDASLLAGIRIASGGWTLGLNLADELRGFAESHHE